MLLACDFDVCFCVTERDTKDRHSKEKEKEKNKRKDKDAVSCLTSNDLFRLSFVGQCQVNSLQWSIQFLLNY